MNINQLLKVIYDNGKPVAARLLVIKTTNESDQQIQFNLENVTAVTFADDKKETIVKMGLLFADGFTLTADFFRDDALAIELLAEFNKGKGTVTNSASFSKVEWNDDEKYSMDLYREAEERRERQRKEEERHEKISYEKICLLLLQIFPLMFFIKFLSVNNFSDEQEGLYMLIYFSILILFSLILVIISDDTYILLKHLFLGKFPNEDDGDNL